MDVVKVVFLFLFSSFVIAATARDITLFEGDVSFNVPEEYVEIAIKNKVNIGYYAEFGNKAIALFAYRKGNFSASKVLEGLDSCLCDLSKYRLVDTEKEYLWNFTTDYVTRKYINDNGRKFASHIRYVTKGAYCLGFWYDTEEDYREFEDVIESLHFSEEDKWGQLRLFLTYSHINWIFQHLSFLTLIFIIGLIVAFARPWKDNLRIIALIAIIALLLLWGFWFLYISLILFLLCFSLLISFIDSRMEKSNKSSGHKGGLSPNNVSSVIEGISEGIDFDIDFD